MIQCWPPMPSAPDLGPAGQESIPARTGPLSPQPGSPVSVVHREWRLSAAVPAPGSELCSLTVTECCGIHKSVSATGGSPQKERSFRKHCDKGQTPEKAGASFGDGRNANSTGHALAQVTSCFRAPLGSPRVCLKLGELAGQAKAWSSCAARSRFAF